MARKSQEGHEDKARHNCPWHAFKLTFTLVCEGNLFPIHVDLLELGFEPLPTPPLLLAILLDVPFQFRPRFMPRRENVSWFHLKYR